MVVRCIRCQAPLTGYKQLCDACESLERQEQLEVKSRVAEGRTMVCPACGSEIQVVTHLCPECGFDLAAPRALRIAGFRIRLLAWFVDNLVLITPTVIILVTSPSRIAALPLLVLLNAVYSVGWWILRGATVGKLVTGLRVVNVDGTRIKVSTAAVRFLGYMLNNLTLYIGWLIILFNPRSQGLHDFLAGTIVVHADSLVGAVPLTRPDHSPAETIRDLT